METAFSLRNSSSTSNASCNISMFSISVNLKPPGLILEQQRIFVHSSSQYFIICFVSVNYFFLVAFLKIPLSKAVVTFFFCDEPYRF